MPVATFINSIPEDVQIGLLELALSFLDAYVIHGISRRCNEKEAILNALKDAPSLAPGIALDNCIELTGNETISYAAVRGKVSKHKYVFPASVNGVQSVYRIIENEEVYAKYGWNGRRYEKPGSFSEKVEFHPFRLTPHCDTSWKESKSFLLINDVSVPNTDDILTTFPTTFTSNTQKSSWYNAVFGYLFGMSTLVGAQRTESLLPVEEAITAIGRIVRTAPGQYVLTAPVEPNALYLLTRKPVEEIIEEYRVQTSELGLFVCLLTVGGVWLLFDAMQRVKSFLYPPPFPDNEDRDEDIYKVKSEDYANSIPDSVLCIVCQEVSRDSVIFPCKHFCTCTRCVSQIIQRGDGTCPLCRERIRRYEKIYFS